MTQGVCTYPRCKCIVSTSTSQPDPICPRGFPREAADARYLRDLAERLMAVPVMYGVNGEDIDRLCLIAKDIAQVPPPSENDRLRAALEFYADPKNWWNENAGDRLKYHNARLDGTVERMNAKVGTLEPAGTRFVHDQFFNDCGDRARAALKRKTSPQPTSPDNLFVRMSKQPDVRVVRDVMCAVLGINPSSDHASDYLDIEVPHRWARFDEWKRLQLLGDWMKAEAYELMDLVEGRDPIDSVGTRD